MNFGWALTPQPATIPIDGSTISVYVDNVPVGHPIYNQYRSDIATLFPGYANSERSGRLLHPRHDHARERHPHDRVEW